MADAKQAVIDQVRQQTALQNVRMIMEKVNEHCFDRCVPKPGSSLSSSEQTCYTTCMEKYMQSWNTVSRQYMVHAQQRVASQGQGLL